MKKQLLLMTFFAVLGITASAAGPSITIEGSRTKKAKLDDFSEQDLWNLKEVLDNAYASKNYADIHWQLYMKGIGSPNTNSRFDWSAVREAVQAHLGFERPQSRIVLKPGKHKGSSPVVAFENMTEKDKDSAYAVMLALQDHRYSEYGQHELMKLALRRFEIELKEDAHFNADSALSAVTRAIFKDRAALSRGISQSVLKSGEDAVLFVAQDLAGRPALAQREREEQRYGAVFVAPENAVDAGSVKDGVPSQLASRVSFDDLQMAIEHAKQIGMHSVNPSSGRREGEYRDALAYVRSLYEKYRAENGGGKNILREEQRALKDIELARAEERLRLATDALDAARSSAEGSVGERRLRRAENDYNTAAKAVSRLLAADYLHVQGVDSSARKKRAKKSRAVGYADRMDAALKFQGEKAGARVEAAKEYSQVPFNKSAARRAGVVLDRGRKEDDQAEQVEVASPENFAVAIGAAVEEAKKLAVEAARDPLAAGAAKAARQRVVSLYEARLEMNPGMADAIGQEEAATLKNIAIVGAQEALQIADEKLEQAKVDAAAVAVDIAAGVPGAKKARAERASAQRTLDAIKEARAHASKRVARLSGVERAVAPEVQEARRRHYQDTVAAKAANEDELDASMLKSHQAIADRGIVSRSGVDAPIQAQLKEVQLHTPAISNDHPAINNGEEPVDPAVKGKQTPVAGKPWLTPGKAAAAATIFELAAAALIVPKLLSAERREQCGAALRSLFSPRQRALMTPEQRKHAWQVIAGAAAAVVGLGFGVKAGYDVYKNRTE